MEICPGLSGYSYYPARARGTVRQLAGRRAQENPRITQPVSEGKLDAITCRLLDQPAIGIVQALEETGRDKDVKVTAIDAGPETRDHGGARQPFVLTRRAAAASIGQSSADNVARYFAGQKLPVQTFIPVVPVKGPGSESGV